MQQAVSSLMDLINRFSILPLRGPHFVKRLRWLVCFSAATLELSVAESAYSSPSRAA